jgi:hypothetical protein
MEITSAAPLPDTGSETVASGAGPDIQVSTVQDLIESGALGESSLHVDASYSPASSGVTPECVLRGMDAGMAADVAHGGAASDAVASR